MSGNKFPVNVDMRTCLSPAWECQYKIHIHIPRLKYTHTKMEYRWMHGAFFFFLDFLNRDHFMMLVETN